MSDMIPFAYGDQPVRVVRIDDEPWFVLVDLDGAVYRVRGLTALSVGTASAFLARAWDERHEWSATNLPDEE